MVGGVGRVRSRIVAEALGVLPLVEHGWGFTLPRKLTQVRSSTLSDVYSAVGAAPISPTLKVDLGAVTVQATDIDGVAATDISPGPMPGSTSPHPTSVRASSSPSAPTTTPRRPTGSGSPHPLRPPRTPWAPHWTWLRLQPAVLTRMERRTRPVVLENVC